MQALSLQRNFVWTVAGNGVYAATRWAVFATIAKTLDTRSVGLYGLGVAICAPVFALLSMNLRAILSTDSRHEIPFRDYLTARILSTAIAFVACTVIALVAGYRGQVFAIVLLLAALQVLEGLADLGYGLFQQVERLDLSAKSVTFRGPARLIAFAVGAIASHDLVIAIAAELAASALVLVLYDFVLVRRVLRQRDGDGARPAWNPSTQQKLFRFALPMAGLILIASLQLYLPRYFVEVYRSTEELGIFVALTVLASALLPVINALAHSASPRLAQYWADGQRDAFRTLQRKLVVTAAAIGTAGMLGALILAKPVLKVIYTPEYAAHNVMLVWLMVAAMLASIASMYGVAITATRKFNAPFAWQAVALVAALPFYVLLTSEYGAIGASLAIIAHSLLTCGGFAFLLRKLEATQ